MLDEKAEGQIMGAVADLKVAVASLKDITLQLSSEVLRLNAAVGHLPCVDRDPDEATRPDCPVLTLRPPPAARERLASVSDDEPDSAVMQLAKAPISVDAGPAHYRGPAIVGLALAAVAALGIALHWLPKIVQLLGG